MLAISRMRKGEQLGTDWVPITLWDRPAQSAAKYLTKGSRVAVEGRIHGDFVPVRGAEGEAKKTQLRLEVIVERITYLSPRRGAVDAAEEKPAGGGRSAR